MAHDSDGCTPLHLAAAAAAAPGALATVQALVGAGRGALLAENQVPGAGHYDAARPAHGPSQPIEQASPLAPA